MNDAVAQPSKGAVTAASSSVSRGRMPALALAAIGIVFGDIGTSPLYTLNTVFDPANGLRLDRPNLIGVVSLLVWALVVIVSVKYVALIMRANNHGEGGIMALLALSASAVAKRPRVRRLLVLAGIFGAALFYGDGVITPAISVLSAVEGLKVATPSLHRLVVPITLAVLVVLFIFQRRGSAGIGAVFGPVMVLWFAVLAGTGAAQVVAEPAILQALNPVAGLAFLLRHGWVAFVSLGAVVLALTGAEALYADMGHFGATPIRVAWFALVFPALVLNYLGQGALLLVEPRAADSPFFRLAPSWALLPLVCLATVATVIASQAVISGAYSMTKQAIQLGFLPRMRILHTSEREVGQVYVPAINWMLLAAVVIAVLGFGSSTALGSAYGIAVTGTMLITTVLTFFVVRFAWHYNWLLSMSATAVFLAIDVAFFSANLLKFVQGGWFPLLVGCVIFTIMSTWKDGRDLLSSQARKRAGTAALRAYLQELFGTGPQRAAGTAVFLTTDPEGVPPALQRSIEHFGVVHEQILFTRITTKEIPYVKPEDRLQLESIGWNCYRLDVRYGFKDKISLTEAMRLCVLKGLALDPEKVSYVLGHALIVATPGSGMWLWREKLFVALSQNVGHLAAYLGLPANQVVELGTRVEI